VGEREGDREIGAEWGQTGLVRDAPPSGADGAGRHEDEEGEAAAAAGRKGVEPRR
jgi:hypothetical protein